MYDYSTPTQTKTTVIRTGPKQHSFLGESFNNLGNRRKRCDGFFAYGDSRLSGETDTTTSPERNFRLYHRPDCQDREVQGLMDELEPVPNKDKLLLIKDLLDVWVKNGDLTSMQALEFYIEMAQILTDEEQ